jgi:hypothetical protein
VITWKTFAGAFPRTPPHLLPENAAAVATDCDFTRGTLTGIRARSQVSGLSLPTGVKSIFVYEGTASSMYAWTRDVNAVRGPVVADAFSRFYWTDGTNFYVSRGDIGGNGAEPETTNRYKVGCPSPTVALTGVLGAAPTLAAGETAVSEFRAYSYSYVNQYGEESGLAPPFTIDVIEGQPVTLTYANLPDSAGYCPISFIRIYRTATGSSSTDYSFVDEIARNLTTPTYTDTVAGDALGAPSQSAAFEAPPQDLKGLCVMNNGILAAFKGNELYFMEPYLPYAYVPATVKPLPHAIVGICPTEDGLCVTTRAFPYLITGVSPDTMTDRQVTAVQAGVSKGSICNVGATVVYASHDGLVTMRGIEASLDFSFNFFTRDVWRDLYASKLSVMRINTHDGSIVVWFEDGTPGFLIRMEEGATSLTQLADAATAAFLYPVGDALYMAYGAAVYEFKGGATTKPWTWRSRDVIVPRPTNFGCLAMIGTGSVTYTVRADGATVVTETVAIDADGNSVFRLPAGFLARRWSVELAGAAASEVRELYLCGSPRELKNG